MEIIKKYWRIVFPVILIFIIWSFSAHNGEVSNSESEHVANLAGFSNAFIRKAAHFILFSALGYSCTSFVKGLHPLTFPKHTQIFYPIIFTIIYGALDEVHQLTVAGRNGSAGDIFLDALAGIAGVLAYIAFFCFYRIRKSKHSSVDDILAQQESQGME